MCNVMNSFGLNRFWQTLRWVLRTNRIVLLGLLVGSAAGAFLLEMVHFYINADGNPSSAVRNVAQMMSFCMILFTAISVSSVFSSFTQLGNKVQRTSWLMLPATHLEKFLALMVHVTLICPVVAFVGFVLGDSLRMAVEYLGASIIEHPVESMVVHWPSGDHTYYWCSSTLPDIVANYAPHFMDDETYHYTTDYCIMSVLFPLSFTMWAHSLFTLGGTLFRKYSFVISGLLLIGWSALLAWIIMSNEISMFNSVWEENRYVSQEVGTGAYVFTILGVVVACLNYWLSFRMFKGFQLITNKWTNYDILKR